MKISRRGFSTLIMIAAIIFIAWEFLSEDTGLGEYFASDILQTEEPAIQNISSDWWEVYFTDPVNNRDPDEWQNSIESELIEKNNTANTSIHIASFEFNLTPVAEALIDAFHRGVEVRWVTDDEFGKFTDNDPGGDNSNCLKMRESKSELITAQI